MIRISMLAVCLLLAPTVTAQHYEQGPVHVMSPWSRALPPVVPNGAVYLTLRNHGEHPDRLLGAASPRAARVEIHAHSMDDGVMKMRRVQSVALPPGEYVKLEPGGLHLMLFELVEPLEENAEFPLTLEFAHAPPLDVVVTVQAMGSMGPDPAAAHGHGSGGHEHQAGTEMSAHGEIMHGAVTGAPAQGEHAEHTAHAALDLPAAEAPTLELVIDDAASGGYTLLLTTGRFRFSEAHADGAHVPGEGHAHLYVDGVKLRRLYGPNDMLPPLSPGVHTVEVSLYSNDHRAYTADARPVSRRVVMRVPAPGEPVAIGGALERIELAIRDGQVDAKRKTVRVTQGDRVELHWHTDARHELHLHGYDMTAEVTPSSPVSMRFGAVFTGRFPIESHDARGHRTLSYLEVYPK